MKAFARLFFILSGLGLIFFAPAVEAVNEQWKYLGANDKAEQFFYDAASEMRISGDIVHVWTRELSADAPKRRLKEINCSFKIIRDLQVIVERPDKAPHTRLTPSGWQAMEGDPVMKELFKILCR